MMDDSWMQEIGNLDIEFGLISFCQRQCKMRNANPNSMCSMLMHIVDCKLYFVCIHIHPSESRGWIFSSTFSHIFSPLN